MRMRFKLSQLMEYSKSKANRDAHSNTIYVTENTANSINLPSQQEEIEK